MKVGCLCGCGQVLKNFISTFPQPQIQLLFSSFRLFYANDFYAVDAYTTRRFSAIVF